MRKSHINTQHKPPSTIKNQQAYILVTVIITLFILASITVLLNRESSMAVNMTASESRVTKARYVAEAGINHALWQANNANCTGYPSSVTNSFGSNSYTISVSPTSGSPVSVSAEGTLASGETINLSRTNLKVYEPPTVVALQPDSTAGLDTYLDEFKPTFNYGDTQNLKVSAVTGKALQSLLKFDLTSIPSGQTITSATLELRVNNASVDSTIVTIHNVTKDWGEGNANWTESNSGINWANSGGDFDSTISASATTPSAQDWVSWDISDLVTDWVNGTSANYGLMLGTTESGKSTQFSSTDAGLPANRPKLTISYSCECGQVCAAAGPTCDGTFRDEFDSRDFLGSNGTLDWSANPWLEVGESDGATNGDIQIRNDVSDYQLQTKDNNNGGEGVEREVDLTGAATATLEYEYRRQSLDDSDDFTTVEISANGAAGPWAELARYQGPDNDSSYTLVTHDIKDYISNNTRIRFKTSADMGGWDRVWFDSVEIQCAP